MTVVWGGVCWTLGSRGLSDACLALQGCNFTLTSTLYCSQQGSAGKDNSASVVKLK